VGFEVIFEVVSGREKDDVILVGFCVLKGMDIMLLNGIMD